MTATDFFDESSEQSQVKAEIVSKYFWAWAKIIMAQQKKHAGSRIAYIDLFAGPGRYRDGTMSTPLKVLQAAIADTDMCERLVTIFNDRDTKNTQSLGLAVADLEGVDKLHYQPVVRNQEVGAEIVKEFESVRLVPTLFFVDPWGYKGLSLRLINSVLRNWGCDCIFFFNYNRINMGLGNRLVQEHMDALFGEERAAGLCKVLSQLRPSQREAMIVEELACALQEMGAGFVLPFCFKNDRGSRTSHHLIFATKSFTAYDVMKEIMANESSSSQQGVATFQYCPAETRQGILFDLSRPLDDLEGMLMKEFKGQTLAVRDIHRRHSVGKPFTRKNYKQVLLQMETAGLVSVPTHKAGTLADHIEITFL